MATLVIPAHANVVNGPPQDQWTHADWQTLSGDNNRYEIIDGVVYQTTAKGWIVLRKI
jgi:hypothetical protein